ncbi:MAG: GAF domain-containing protein [Thermoanaerobaculia bacterium]|nr:GAF domain-containing protein [Thermoanaerobaculia bacterium]
MVGRAKPEVYSTIVSQLTELLDGTGDPIATMASAAAVVHGEVEYASWTGFYRVVEPGLLRIGPYQGPIGCLEIPFDRGVCGAAARRRETVIVDDVHAFAGHIACDPASRSEIVVPVLDPSGALVAVLDVDSRLPAAFDDEDRRGLERVAGLVGQRC